MSRRSVLVGGVLAAGSVAAGCSSSGAAAGARPSVVADGETVIMIIRHAEKPTGSGAPYGVTAAGERDDESLTPTGWARAGALVGLFDPTTSNGRASLRTGLARPARVIAPRAAGGSARPLETITPLVRRLGTAADTRWKKGEEKDVAHHVAGLTGATLIAWEHKNIIEIAGHLADHTRVTPAPPTSWPGDRFDVVWCFRRGADGWTFYQVPELLLAGDRPNGI